MQDIKQITSEKLEDAMSKMKIGKTTALDNITLEMRKGRKDNLKEMLNDKIVRNWQQGNSYTDTQERSPRECNNYRLITVINTVGKIVVQITETRIKEELDF